MRDRSWRIRTTDGVVIVRENEIGIRTTPREFLAGQLARWRAGGYRERARTLRYLLGLPLVIGLFCYAVVRGPISEGWDLAQFVQIVSWLLLVYSVWRNHLRERTVPLSDVEDIDLDAEERTLTVTHDSADHGSLFKSDRREQTFQLPTEEDLREAREIVRLRKLPDDGAPETEASGPIYQGEETVYRFDTRGGVCFCQRCGSQISPADANCPACGYALRVQGPVSTEETAG